ncbi:hypothetical protein CRG98_006000 [Punica granatum]|uniref:DUF538 domain-containing protein n=1 Tax=Punica granatum TaxID=22663 RepID=A0A2I0L0I3_PUNGR|nr:hypothetical protein CRG98_006000 [Punica granatum]
MASSSPPPFLSALILLFVVFVLSAGPSLSIRTPELASNVPSRVADVHDLLPKYGFPRGLIPNNVKSYNLSDDGSFEIQLGRPCYVHFDELVYYDRRIKGKMSYGSAAGVSGIQAKKLFVWVSVTAIQVDSASGMMEFYVGALSEKLPMKQFERIPECSSKASLEDETDKKAAMK